MPDVICKVTYKNSPLLNANVKIYRNDVFMKKKNTNSNGEVKIKLRVNKKYHILISEEGLITQRIEISTFIPKSDLDYKLSKFSFNINMFLSMPEMEDYVYLYPMVKIIYDAKNKTLKIDEKYKIEADEKINVIKSKLLEIRENTFDEYLKKGLQLLDLQRYEEAWLLYDKANRLFPNKKQVIDKIEAIKQLISLTTSFDIAFNEAINNADKLKASNKEQAIKFYQKALLYQPSAVYPRKQIKQIKKYTKETDLLKKKAFNSKLREADNNFSKKKYDLAKRNYKEAIKLNKKSQYPLKQLTRIESLIRMDSLSRTSDTNAIKERIAKKVSKIITKGKEDIETAQLLSELGEDYLNAGYFDNAVESYNKTIELNKKLGSDTCNSIVYKKIAEINKTTYNYKSAINNLKDALTIEKNNNNKKGESELYNAIGEIFLKQENIDSALSFFKKSLNISEKGKGKESAAIYNNIGVAYYNEGDFESAIKYYEKSLKNLEKTGDKKDIAISLNNIGNVNYDWEKYIKAIEYYEKSLKYKKEANFNKGVINSLFNIANAYIKLGDIDKAENYYKNSLKLAETLQETKSVSKACKALAKISKNRGDYLNAYKYLDKYKSSTESLFEGEESKQISEIQSKYSNIQKDRKINKLQKELVNRDLYTRFKNEKARREIDLLQKENQLKSIRMRQNKMLIYSLVGGAFLLLILAIVYFNRFKIKKNALKLIEEAQKTILAEKEKSDKLLLNILPIKVARELKETGKVKAILYKDVTVLFSDIVDFTRISSNLSPEELIKDLNTLFTGFDEVMENHNCERIKTIGDGYLAVCGVPGGDSNHAENIANAAIDMMVFLEELNKKSQRKWNLRIGIHSGEVVGGVVGIKKYTYDIFGDTLNTASRIEQSSLTNRINVSRKTFEIIEQKYDFEERNEIQIKGKGMMKMYFLNGKKTRNSV